MIKPSVRPFVRLSRPLGELWGLGVKGGPLSGGVPGSDVFPSTSLTLVAGSTDFKPFEWGKKEQSKCRRFFVS